MYIMYVKIHFMGLFKNYVTTFCYAKLCEIYSTCTKQHFRDAFISIQYALSARAETAGLSTQYTNHRAGENSNKATNTVR